MFPPVSPAVRPHASLSIDTRSNSTVLELAERAEGWLPGDRVVVASTDYSMNQAEEFTLLPCPSCLPTQVKVQGESQFLAPFSVCYHGDRLSFVSQAFPPKCQFGRSWLGDNVALTTRSEVFVRVFACVCLCVCLFQAGTVFKA